MGEVADDVGKGFSDLWDDVIEGSKQIGEKIGWGKAHGPSKRTRRDVAAQRRAAFEASRPRRPATIDDARARQLETDRLARRRGVLANVYGGARAESPSVAVKQLLGS